MLANCAAYKDGTKVGDISVENIAQHLQQPHSFVWVELHDPTADELSELQKVFDLHPLAVEDALVGHQRPKIEEYGDSLFAVLHLVEPANDDYQVGERGRGPVVPAERVGAPRRHRPLRARKLSYLEISTARRWLLGKSPLS